MSFKTRMEQLEADITTLENATPFVLTQPYVPNQKDWEEAWLAAGYTLPIPTYQELYWHDGFVLRGEFKALPDQFSLLARSQSTGFQIRDIAGWDHFNPLVDWDIPNSLYVYVVRDDPNAPQGACRMYMDGTLEELVYAGFNPDGLLAYNWFANDLWYYEGLVIKRISVITGTISTIFTAAASGLPEWRFFIFANTSGVDSGDCYFGAKIGADADRSLYYFDHSVGSLTKMMTTFNPGTGAVRPDRPLGFTDNYVFLSEAKSRAAFDGNIIHQIRRSDHTWQIKVNDGVSSVGEVRVMINKTDYANDTIQVIVGHIASTLTVDWDFTTHWAAATQTATTTPQQPHNRLLQTLRQNINDHSLTYHMDTRLYYDPAFIADGGSEIHYNSIGGLLPNVREDMYLVYDLGWHTWTIADAPDLFVYAHPEGKLYDSKLDPVTYPPVPFATIFPIDYTPDSYIPSTHKVYRISDWSQFDDDILIVYHDTDTRLSFSLADIPADYGMIEVIHESRTDAVSGAHAYLNAPIGGGLHSSNTQVLAQVDGSALLNFAGEIATAASVRHYFIPRYKFTSDEELHNIVRHNSRTATSSHVHIFAEGMFLKTAEDEVITFTLPAVTGAGAVQIRFVVRAWRTVPRVKQNGAEYDPSLA